jgi:hypothetical protein
MTRSPDPNCLSYWYPKLLEASVPDWEARLEALNRETAEEVNLLSRWSEQVSRHFDAAWSLDWARRADGRWIALDMAAAERSFHWPGCPAAVVPAPGQAAGEP